MILLFGGTREGKKLAGWLEAAGLDYIYSTKTNTLFEGKGYYRWGALSREEMEALCRQEKISCIISASHPFARELHQTIASTSLPIPHIRFERAFSERLEHPLLHYVEDYAEALSLLLDKGIPSLLALSGVQSIPSLKPFWESHPCWFRILDREVSKELAASYGFPANQLLYGLPQDKAEEVALLKKLKAAAILTKESGTNGMLHAKIEAAIACQIPLFILKKPALPPRFRLVHSREELLSCFQLE